jgi:acetolactate synthase-1/2/3 large subunit
MAEPVVKRWWQPTVWSRFPPRSRRPSTPCTKAAAARTVDIPQDLQAEYGEYTAASGHAACRRALHQRPRCDRQAAELLAHAKRPVILAGRA